MEQVKKRSATHVVLIKSITSITSVPANGTVVPCCDSYRVVIVPIEFDVPPLRVKLSRSNWEGAYEDDASLLCGNWLRGGTLVFQAASGCCRSSQSV